MPSIWKPGLAMLLLTTAPALAVTAESKPRVTVDLRQLRPDGDTPMVRLAQPANDPDTWLTVADYPAEFSKADQRLWVRFAMAVDPAGTITKCDASGSILSTGKPAADPDQAATKLCAVLIKRARMIPALTLSGNRIAGNIRGYADFAMVPANSRGPGGLATMPPPPMPIKAWPPDYPSSFVKVLALPDLTRSVAKKVRAGWTGELGLRLDIADDGKVQGCDVLKPSGTPAIDEASCKGMDKGKFEVPRPIAYTGGHNPLKVLVRWDNGEAKLWPATQYPRGGRPNPDAWAMLQDELLRAYPKAVKMPAALELAVTAEGKVEQCLVLASSADDTLDRAICAQATRHTDLVLPGNDVFGLPVPGRVVGPDLKWPGQSPKP